MKVIYYLCLLGIPFSSFSQVQIGTELQTSIRTKTLHDSYNDRVDVGLNCVVFLGKHKISAEPLLSSQKTFQYNESKQFKINGLNTNYGYCIADKGVFNLNLALDLFYNFNRKATAELYDAKSPNFNSNQTPVLIDHGYRHNFNYLVGFNFHFDLAKHFYSGLKLQAGNAIGWSRIHDPNDQIEPNNVKLSCLSSALQFQIGYKF